MTESLPSAPQLPEGRFVGRQAFVGLVRQAIECAAREGWPSLLLSDADFSDWPLGERAVVDAFNAWAGRGRQLRLLAQDYRLVRQQHPRFVQWRVTWAHLVEAQVWPGAAAGDLPSAIWSPGWTLERLDPLRCVGVTSFDGVRRVDLRERVDAAWQRGGPGFAATVLGL
jgi:hypothetical protein